MLLLASNLTNTVDVSTPVLLSGPGGRPTDFSGTFGFHTLHLPSNLGGTLQVSVAESRWDPDTLCTVQSSDGTMHALQDTGPGGKITVEIPENTRGNARWRIYVKAPSGSYSVRATFVESVHAVDADGNPLIPWNFWYFPYSHKYAETSAWAGKRFKPLHKYEKAFGVSGALEWEKTHHNDPARNKLDWAGHCHMAAAASIAFEEPPRDGLKYRGVHFTAEEIKLLAAEIMGSHLDAKVHWKLNQSPVYAGNKPTDVPPESFGHLLHGLRDKLRLCFNHGSAILADFRDHSGGDPDEKWNQAIYMYETRYWQERPRDLTWVRARTTLFANGDLVSSAGDSTGLPAEVIEQHGKRYVVPNGTGTARQIDYEMRFAADGQPVLDTGSYRWHSVTAPGSSTSLHPPRYFLAVHGLQLARRTDAEGNPLVDKDDVLKLLGTRKLRSPP